MANNLNIFNRRMLIKRSSITLEVPTIPNPAVATDVNDHTQGGWLATDIYEGELFINTADNKAWIRYNSGIVQLASASGFPTLVELTDTPGNYTGAGGYLLQVNSGETGVEFVANTNIDTIIGLTDTPATITDDKILVGSSGAYIEVDYINEFDKLTDIDNFAGNAGNIYVVNVGETNLDSVAGNSLFVDLLANQTIAGHKTFTESAIFPGITTTGITLNSNTFNDVIIDVDLIGALDTNIPSTLAIKTYVDTLVTTAVGGDYVPRTGAFTISDTKTFADDTIFSSDIDVAGEINAENIKQAVDAYHYFGSETVDGSFRMMVNPLGDLEIQKRISGTWVYRANF